MTHDIDEPFSITHSDGDTTIIVNPVVCQKPQVVSDASNDWIRGLKGKINVNFYHVHQVNSTLVAWLFQLVQWNRGRVSLAEASRGVRRQLKQYHLQHFIDFPQQDLESSAYLPGTR